jgi:segregation and condensation protein A
MAKTASQFSIDLPTYSGPLDLLLHLIEKKELDITAISLSLVTEQYLSRVNQLREDRVEGLIDFLVIGARLLVIKSRALLPQPDDALLDRDEEEDPAESLARQLRRYRRFKQSALWLAEREALGLRTYLHMAPALKTESSLDMSGIGPSTLKAALASIFLRANQMEDSVSVAVSDRKHTIDSKIDQLRERIKYTSRMRFDDLLSDNITWSEVSVALLAVLELVKRHEVNVYQKELFGPIQIELAR